MDLWVVEEGDGGWLSGMVGEEWTRRAFLVHRWR